MDLQFDMLKRMIAAETNFIAEVNDPGNEEDHIHGYYSIEDLHIQFPRATITVVNWSGDFNLGNCNESVGFRLLMEIKRDIPDKEDATALTEQYREVLKFFRDFGNGLSAMSYGSPDPGFNYLGNMRCDIAEGVWVEPLDEDDLIDPSEGTQQIVWYADYSITPLSLS